MVNQNHGCNKVGRGIKKERGQGEAAKQNKRNKNLIKLKPKSGSKRL